MSCPRFRRATLRPVRTGAPLPASTAPERRALGSVLASASPAPGAQQAAAPPAPGRPRPAPDAGQQAASPPAPTAPPPRALGSARRRPGASRLLQLRLAEPPLPPARARTGGAGSRGRIAPKSLAQLVGTWAYSAADCERLFQRRGGGWAYREPVDKFAQAAIVESPKKILLPSATCRIDGASGADGVLKVSADCEDSISYTPRSVMIALRSPTELVYSATGDPALATTLKKCAP